MAMHSEIVLFSIDAVDRLRRVIALPLPCQGLDRGLSRHAASSKLLLLAHEARGGRAGPRKGEEAQNGSDLQRGAR
jgi:hypothetical protein